MNLKNTVIKVLNREHGKIVKAFFEKNGVDTIGYNFIYTEEEDGSDACIYYGLIGEIFTNVSIDTVKNSNIKIIELPMKNTIKIGEETIDLTLPFPREMEVWDTTIKSSRIELVHAIINRKSNSKIVGDIFMWKYCKEIPPVRKMTVAEIEKQLGYKVEVIS